MKKYLLLISLVFSTLIFSQTVTINETQVKYTVRNYRGINPDFSLFAFTDAYDIGNYNADSHKWMEWVSCYKISLNGIPSGYTIKSIDLTAKITQQEYTPNNFVAIVNKMPNNTDLSTTSSNAEPLYNAISDINTQIGSFKYSDTLSQDIKSSITASDFADNYIIIGVYSYTSDDNSMAKISISLTITYYLPINMTIDNNFVDNSGSGTHGQVSIDGTTQTIPSSGISLTRNVDQNLTLSANSPQQDNQGYQRTWNTGSVSSSDWRRNNVFKSSNQTYSFPVAADDGGKTYMANLKKVCNVTFQNSLPEGGNTGSIIVDGSSYNVTKTTQKIEGNSVSFASTYQSTNNGIASIFDHWSGGSTASSSSATINGHTTITAFYKGEASLANRNLRISSTVGQPDTVKWNEHPCSNVAQYRIYRKVRPAGGTTGPEVLIATVNRGTTSYVDRDYIVSNVFYYQLFYDVRYVYSGQCDGVNYTTESDMSFVSTFADESERAQMENSSDKKMVTKELPSEYSLNNYPNPFNPTTTINYQLPSEGMVTLKVYDVIGKEVATLVDGHRAAGTYNIEFNASDLPSGIYIYRLSANNFTQSKKMLLVK